MSKLALEKVHNKRLKYQIISDEKEATKKIRPILLFWRSCVIFCAKTSICCPLLLCAPLFCPVTSNTSHESEEGKAEKKKKRNAVVSFRSNRKEIADHFIAIRRVNGENKIIIIDGTRSVAGTFERTTTCDDSRLLSSLNASQSSHSHSTRSDESLISERKL